MTNDVESQPRPVLKEVTVFATGDPNAPSTWSSIPHFLVETLRRNHVKVNTVNLAPTPLFRRICEASLRLAKTPSEYSYFRTPIHEWDVNRRIRRAVASFPHSQLNLFLTFSFVAEKQSSAPSVQICDWPFEYYVRHFQQRTPTALERESIGRERKNMQLASLVVTLFSGVKKFLETEYPLARSAYLGHVINTTRSVNKDQVMAAKEASEDILFVGRAKYLSGAKRLVQAFDLLKPTRPNLRLHVVGLSAQQLGKIRQDITCYGYLDKGNPEDEAKYYELIKNAIVIVNPTARWGGFSSLVEAMYFYTPVVATPYSEFVEAFGNSLSFGAYCHDESIPSLCSAIEQTIAEEGYQERCSRAHAAAMPHTWANFVGKLAGELEFSLPTGDTASP